MPLPVKPPKEKKTGPTPLCECGICSMCKNRARQKRWYERRKLKLELGVNLNEDELSSMLEKFEETND